MLLQLKQDLLSSNIFTLSEIKCCYLYMISGGKLDLRFASKLLLLLLRMLPEHSKLDLFYYSAKAGRDFLPRCFFHDSQSNQPSI